MQPVAQTKADLRARFRNLPLEGYPELSARTGDRLSRLELFRSARTVAFFRAKLPEPDITGAARMLESQGVKLAWPKVTGDGVMEFRLAPSAGPFESGAFGLCEPPATGEPVALSALDAIVVPALAYDSEGYRLGRGKGFYDRVLGDPAFRGISVGVVADSHLVEKLPREPWDRPVSMVVTDARSLDFAKKTHKEN